MSKNSVLDSPYGKRLIKVSAFIIQYGGLFMFSAFLIDILGVDSVIFTYKTGLAALGLIFFSLLTTILILKKYIKQELRKQNIENIYNYVLGRDDEENT